MGVTGFGVTGLDSTYVVPQGTGGCTKSSGCGTIFGHTSMLSADASKVEWKKTFNNFKGGKVEYAGLEPFSDAVVLTECWGLTTTVDAQGEPTGLAAACGQGIEGCALLCPRARTATFLLILVVMGEKSCLSFQR